MSSDDGLRIGELSARVQVGTHTLRAWERRYGLLRPSRTLGGYRLYGVEDEQRIRAVLTLRDQGIPVAEAAARVLTASPPASGRGSPDPLRQFAAAMAAAVDIYDEAGADAAIESLLQAVGLATAIDEAVMPFLFELGQRWQRGEVTVAHEHFASAALKRRFSGLTLTRGPDAPVVVLATPAGEHHDLPLVLFSALLSRAGCRTRMLGANTPAVDLMAASGDTAAVVLAATAPQLFTAAAPQLVQLSVPLLIAGRGATAEIADQLGAIRLPPALGAACDQVAQLVAGR